MVTNPKIGVFHFVFLKLPRAKGKMDIFGGQINVQFWGVKIGQFWGVKIGQFWGGSKTDIFPIFKRNIFGEKVVQTYTLDLISLKV
jgi:hypothetical protein